VAVRPTDDVVSRVPRILALFWVVKGLSTAFGESASDYLVHAWAAQVAVLVGFVAFLVALGVQLTQRRYVAWAYWSAVCMVGLFGTMAADVMHVALHVPYVLSSAFYGALLAAVFVVWYRVEGTLSIHEVTTTRRELFYWATVVSTFAMGTALGDFVANTLHVGYLAAAVIFAALICVPAAGYRWFSWNPVLAFWTAYVITRPLGASVADWLGKPTDVGGLGLGPAPVTFAFLGLIVVLVAYLAVTKVDVQARPTPLVQPQPQQP
jgi:uncharacterized membrane-anchored protein